MKRQRKYTRRALAGVESLEVRRLLDSHGVTADLDLDGVVGFSDFLRLSASFGKRFGQHVASSRGDVDGDGHVGFSDFLVLSRDFGKQVSSDPPGQDPNQNPHRLNSHAEQSRSSRRFGEFVHSIERGGPNGELPFHGLPDEVSDVEVVFHPIIQAGRVDGTPPDSPDNRIDPNVSTSPFAGVGSLEVSDSGLTFLCTASVIAPTQVLTAAHCFDSDGDGVANEGVEATFYLNSNGSFSSTHVVSSFSIHPGFQGFNTNPNDDWAVLELADAVPASTPTYRISPDRIVSGDELELVGYGFSGDGDNGFTVLPSFEVKRSGSNIADLMVLDDDGEFHTEIYVVDFDGPAGEADGFLGGTTLGNDIETMVGAGDSGGPAFVTINGQRVIAGINTFTWELVGISEPAGFFGSMAGGNMTGAYIDWLAEVAPNSILSNEAPSFTAGPAAISVFEDAGLQAIAWATDVSAGEPDQSVEFHVSNSNPDLFDAPPTISPSGELSFSGKPNAYGVASVTVYLQDDGGTDYGASDTSPEVTFEISVLPVNDAPTITLSGDVVANQTSRSNAIRNFLTFDPGPGESSQAIAEILASNDNPQLFDVAPSIDSSGRLKFTPSGVTGSATVEVQVRDDGGTDHSGVDLSDVQSFVITVTEGGGGGGGNPGDPPGGETGDLSFTVLGDVTAVEDAGATRIDGFAVEIGDGVVGFELVADDDALFRLSPQLTHNGALRFTPASNAWGTTNVAVQAVGSDGSMSEIQVFMLSLTPVNDAPKLSVQRLVEASNVSPEPQAIDGFAQFDPGNEYELDQQAIEYLLVHDNPELFAVEPAIDLLGQLTFQLADGATGEAHVRATVRDDGGTENGGVDTSLPELFTIRAGITDEISPELEALVDQFHTLLASIESFSAASQLMRSIDLVVASIDEDFKPASNLLTKLDNEILSAVRSNRISLQFSIELFAITAEMRAYFEANAVRALGDGLGAGDETDLDQGVTGI